MLYEIDRREKKQFRHRRPEPVEIAQRVHILTGQLLVLSTQLSASERQIQELSNQKAGPTSPLGSRELLGPPNGILATHA
jgi:hypothetical protein